MVEPTARSSSLSPALAWTLLIGGGGLALWRGAHAVYWLFQWSAAKVTDPSGAELYLVSFWIELAFAIITFAIGLGGFRLMPREHGDR